MDRKSRFTAVLAVAALAATGHHRAATAQAGNGVADVPAAGTPIGRSAFERAVGPTIVDRGSELYRFADFKLPSADGKRHYWVQVGIPKAPPPREGYPVLYMVDGNAAIGLVNEPELEALNILSPPVLVAVGYDTYSRVDTLSRAYDYTPPVTQDGKPIAPVVRGRPGGGAEIFARFIEGEIKPRVEALASIDRNRQTLWGHSYGGLFALYMLQAYPGYYQRYAAGDASLWYHDGELVQALLATRPGTLKGRTVRLMSGGGRTAANGGSAQRGAPAATEGQAERAPMPQATERLPDTSKGLPRTPDAMEKVVKALGAAGADISYRQFAGLNHGEMMRASLLPALILAADPQKRP